MGKRGPKANENSRTEVITIAVSPKEKEKLMAYVDAQGGTISSALYPILKMGVEAKEFTAQPGPIDPMLQAIIDYAAKSMLNKPKEAADEQKKATE